MKFIKQKIERGQLIFILTYYSLNVPRDKIWSILKILNTLKLQLDKLNAIGGVDSIVPSEGIVFKYNGKTYKFTGAFAPVNQIAGLINF